ncbi:MAG: hypothetical protein AAGK05_18365 [Pseudomonadota bacterium]
MYSNDSSQIKSKNRGQFYVTSVSRAFFAENSDRLRSYFIFNSIWLFSTLYYATQGTYKFLSFNQLYHDLWLLPTDLILFVQPDKVCGVVREVPFAAAAEKYIGETGNSRRTRHQQRAV